MANAGQHLAQSMHLTEQRFEDYEWLTSNGTSHERALMQIGVSDDDWKKMLAAREKRERR